MSSRLCSAVRTSISQTGVGFSLVSKCVMSKTTRPDGSLQHIYNATMKTNTVSSLFPNTPTARQTQQGTPGHAEARRDVRGGRWSFRVLCQTHSPNRGQWCPSMVVITDPPSIDLITKVSLLLLFICRKTLTVMLRTWSNLFKEIRFKISAWQTQNLQKTHRLVLKTYVATRIL